MKKEFIDKDVYFIGDSITAHGFYINDCNAYMKTESENCRLFNRGYGGARSSVALGYIEDEIKDICAGDVAFLSFGVNDMGVWLYDGLKEETPELLEKREARLNVCIDGYRKLIEILRAEGISPVIFITIAANQYLAERENIQTVADNKEKEDYIGPSFYTRKTYARINDGIARLCSKLSDLSEQEGVPFLSCFEYFKEVSATEGDKIYGPDGIHLTEYGHSLLAKRVLEFMGCEDVPETFDGLARCDEVIALTNAEREPGWLPCILCEGDLARANELAAQILSDKNSSERYLRSAKGYLEKYKNRHSARKAIKKAVYEWFGKELPASVNE